MPRFSIPRLVRSFTRGRLLLTCIVMCLGAASATAQRTLHVDTTSDTLHSTNDCLSGSGTSCSLRDAMTQANSGGDFDDGDTIVFNSGLTGTITLTSILPVIYSGGSIQGPGANVLTISGNGNSSVGSIFDIQGSSGFSLSGLTVTGGTGNSIAGGGALLIYSPNAVSVSDCVFIDNSNYNAHISTSGIYASGGAIALVRDAGGPGGSLKVTNSTFIGNSANFSGGAISFNAGTSGTVTNSTFFGNTSPFGGAIESDGTTTITNSTFSGNSATAYFNSYGGAIAGGSLTVTNSIFTGNSAQQCGAVINGSVHASNNVYYNNIDVESSSEDDCNGCSSDDNATSAASDPLALPPGYYGAAQPKRICPRRAAQPSVQDRPARPPAPDSPLTSADFRSTQPIAPTAAWTPAPIKPIT